MKPITLLVALAFAATADAQTEPKHHQRIGAPADTAPTVVRSAADPADMDGLHTPTDAFDPVLEAELDAPDGTYGAGVAPKLTVRLKRHDGSLIPGNIYTDDVREKSHRKGKRNKGGDYSVSLDATPGEHYVDVNADVVVNGNSTHRGVSMFYQVGTGNVTVVDVGTPRQDATTLYVPLILNVTVPDYYELRGSLSTNDTVVAGANTSLYLTPGAKVELQFDLADLVEPGPYHLTDVMVLGGGHKGKGEIGGVPSHPLADARPRVGKPIAVRRDKNLGPPVPPPTLTADEQAGRDAVLNPAPSAPELP